jgi:phosphatidylserine/phosphatidylglycerophosphate/cardiolipin synthase-like enzyme
MKFIEGAKILYNKIVEIIDEAEEFVFIISPFIRFGKGSFFLRLFQQAYNKSMNRKIEYTFITNKDQKDNISKIKEFVKYARWVYLVPYLHSKIYCNESKALVTSLNLSFDSIANRNEEAGIIIEKNNQNESQEYFNIIEYINRLKKTADSLISPFL